LNVIELLQLAGAIGFDPMPAIRAAWKSVQGTGAQ
jgi:hypothetical protein